MEKKSAKWQCKLCGERQSLKQVSNIAFQTSASKVFYSHGSNVQVFARGSGPECRKAVQELNLKRMEMGRQEEQKLEAAIIEEENREMDRFAENMEEEQHNELKLEGNLEGARLLEEDARSPLAPLALQAAVSGSRWEKFLPSSTSTWEEEEDDLEEERDGNFCSENKPVPSWGVDGYENLQGGLHGVPSIKNKSCFGKRKANDAHVEKTTGNVSSKWGKFSS